ncbi:MAG: hypothetical protein GX664_01315, partial [Bacteroidales bacterium]|nr:hypothetical protein [Bacteroidales bacterium]
MKKIIFLFAALLAFASCNQAPEVAVPESYNDFRDWSLTPPMGWNSWDCYGPTVVESEL